ncbi:hypothetical protein MKX03_002691 [Papaver bracteatum]|nr:hypothetical protein MKX03_002691 [Papaver bracteatum]
MSLELIGGALLGAVVSELLEVVIHTKAKATSFKPFLEKLTITLESVIPGVEEIKRLDDEERMRTDSQKGPDLKRLIVLLREGTILVEKCSAVQSWNYILKKKYSGMIQKLDNDLIRFFQLDAQVAILFDVKKIRGMVNNLDQQLKQLTTERENGSSSNNGAAARDGDRGVNDLKAAVSIKPTITSVPQKVGSAKASQKLDRQSESAAPIKPRNHDLKAALPIKPAIILTSTDPQKVGSAKARLGRHSESSASVNPNNHYLKAAVSITSADCQKDFICMSESTAHTPSIIGAVVWYAKSFGGVAKTSLSQGLDLNFMLNCDSKEISTNSMDIEYEPPWIEPPWILSETTHSSAFFYKAARLVVLTKFHNYRPLAINYIYDTVKREHHKHMELVESIRHENVVRLRAYYCHYRPVPDDQLGCLNMKIVLVYDYCRKGSVHKMLHGKLKVPFDWDTRLRVAVGVARGVAFIHRQDNGTFSHGGIKSDNMFLNTGNYGCISELGKSIAGYREPYLTGTGSLGRLQEIDVYNYGIFLLELVTGNYPYNGIVENFKMYVGSREQLDSKIEYFIRPKQLNRGVLYFQMLDPELVKHYGELKGQLIEMLRIAWECVAYGVNRAPKMTAVVKMVEFIGRLQLPHEFVYPFKDE